MGDVVDGVVAVRIGCEDRAVEILVRALEEARNLLERFPGLGNAPRLAVLSEIADLLVRVVKGIGAIDQTLGAVVVGQAEHHIVELVHLEQ